jgi:hypothetical protein
MAKGWQITSQKLETVVNPDGPGFSQQWNIGYLITEGPAKGIRGEVHATTGQLDGDYVERAVAVMAERHNRLAGL